MPQTKRHWIDRAADPSTPTTDDNETVRTATFEYDGKYYLVPTIRMGEDGKLYKPENPLSEALDRGDAEEFDTQEDADRMSRQVSDYIGRSRGKEFADGGFVKDVDVNYNTSEGSGETGEAFRGAATFGNEDASIRPSLEYNKNARQRQFDDGVVLNERGKRIGVAINGEIKLAEGIKLRGGIQKVTQTGGGTAIYKGDVIDEFEGKSRELNANVGAQLGKLNIDYERRKREQAPSTSTFSAGYQIDKDSNISGSLDLPSKRLNVEYKKRFAKGGNVEQMNKLFAEGGMMDDSGDVINGVEVPPGSLKEEVADDIPAQLSEGEFVVPADVVRFIGLEKLMAMRDKAKEGLKRMEEMGQMGNADEVENPDQAFDEVDDEQFGSEIDSILAEDSSMPSGFARGGFASGTDLTKASRNPMVDVRFFKNKEGKVMFITHINGVPLVPIPEGFSETDESYEQLIGSEADKKAAEEEAAKAEELKRLAALGMGASGGDSSGGPQGPTAAVNPNDLSRAITIDPKTGVATAKDFSKWAKLAMLILPAPIAVAIQAGAKLTAEQNKEIADKWNASEKYFNKDAVVGKDQSTGWVNLAAAVESGMGYTVTGQGVSSTRSVQMQNDDLLDGLTEDEKALYAVPGTAEAAFQRETAIMDREEALDASIMQGESRAREAARVAAEKEAAQKAADEAAAAQKAAAERAATEARIAEAQRTAVYSAPAYSSGNNDGSSTTSGTYDTYTGATETYGDTSYGTLFAKGGLLKKREANKPAKKKGLAAKRK